MYIRCHELEAILMCYRELEGLVNVLEIQAATVLDGEEEDEIYGQMVKRKIDGQPVGHGKVFDRTATLGIDMRQLSNEARAAVKEIWDELILVETILLKLKIAHGILTYRQKEVVRLKYFERFVWKEIAAKMNLSERSVIHDRKKAIEKMTRLCRISIEEYKKTMGLLKSEGRMNDE